MFGSGGFWELPPLPLLGALLVSGVAGGAERLEVAAPEQVDVAAMGPDVVGGGGGGGDAAVEAEAAERFGAELVGAEGAPAGGGVEAARRDQRTAFAVVPAFDVRPARLEGGRTDRHQRWPSMASALDLTSM